MKSSNRSVKRAMRSRRSSKPKLILGRESAIDGASAEERGGCEMLAESEDSNIVAIMKLRRRRYLRISRLVRSIRFRDRCDGAMLTGAYKGKAADALNVYFKRLPIRRLATVLVNFGAYITFSVSLSK